MPPRICVLLAIYSAFAIGCSRDSRRSVPPALASSASESSIQAITNGANVADLVTIFGPPVSEKVVEGSSVLTFLFANSPPNTSHVIGVMVDVKDGKVQRHTPITGDPLPFEWDPRASREAPAPPLLMKSVKSAITLHPLMIAPTEIIEGDIRIVMKAIVDLSEEDVKRFSSFTQSNLHQKVEVFLGDTLLSDFYILERIETNEFELRIPQGVHLERLFTPTSFSPSNPGKK